MKNSILLSVIILIVLLGAAGLFYVESKLPDNGLIDREVNTYLLKVDRLNSSINELSLRSRANLDSNYDMLVRSTTSLERMIDKLSNGHLNSKLIEGSLLETKFDRFRESLVVKSDQVESFKSSNSVLRNSEKYMLLVGTELSEVARSNGLSEVSSLYSRIVIGMLEFTKQDNSRSINEVVEYASDILKTEALMPEASKTKILEFANHVGKAIGSKSKVDLYLGKVLNSSSRDQIEGIIDAWDQWQGERNNTQAILFYYSAAYVITILGLIGLLAFRVRSLYLNLDVQVEQKDREVQAAYGELGESQRQLAQNEKMVSLGQRAAVTAQDINMSLSQITLNMNTIKAWFGDLSPVLEKAQEISITLADPNREKPALNKLLKQQVIAFRSIGKNTTVENLNMLIDDALSDLKNIKETTNSLTKDSEI